MELYFLDNEFDTVDIIDEFSSVVWAEKFHSVGSFTLIIPRKYAPRIKNAVYVRTGFDSDGCKCGRIERLSVGDGIDCTVSGYMLEALLSDRVIAGKGTVSGSVTECIIEAVGSTLAKCGVSVAPKLAEIAETVTLSYGYNRLSDWLYQSLKPYGASFRVTLDADSDSPVFSLILGKDRTEGSASGEQPAIFSSEFENIVSLEYEQNSAEMKNFIFVEGADGTIVSVDKSSGGKKRELYSLCDDISPEDFNGEDEYHAALSTRGNELLAKCADGMRISVECDSDALPSYGEHYSLGDVCDVYDAELGLSFKLRVTSLDTVWENGRKTFFPSFGDEIISIRSLIEARQNKI